MNYLSDFYKGKKVLITGHTGFKGSWLSLVLKQFGAYVYGYALTPPSTPSLYVEANIDSIITSYIGDIRDYSNLLRVLNEVKPEIVIHMAAQALVRESYLNPIETYSVNVMGTVNLFEAIRHCSSIKAVVNVTSDKCYENKEWAWGYRENEPMGGYDPYSCSKGCSELITSSFRKSFFNPTDYDKHHLLIASARVGNVIGGGDWATDRLIPDFIRSITLGENLKIRNPQAIRPWQHVLEPLCGYLMLAEKLYCGKDKFADSWNLGPEDLDAKNVEWVSSRICQLWNDNVSFKIEDKLNPHEANYLKLDCSKAKAILGWTPKWNIETTLEKVVEWYKAFYNHQNAHTMCEHQIKEYFNLIN